MHYADNYILYNYLDAELFSCINLIKHFASLGLPSTFLRIRKSVEFIKLTPVKFIFLGKVALI